MVNGQLKFKGRYLDNLNLLDDLNVRQLELGFLRDICPGELTLLGNLLQIEILTLRNDRILSDRSAEEFHDIFSVGLVSLNALQLKDNVLSESDQVRWNWVQYVPNLKELVLQSCINLSDELIRELNDLECLSDLRLVDFFDRFRIYN